MTLRIYKYALQVCDTQLVMMPAGAKILDFQIQADEWCIWALVDDTVVMAEVTIHVRGTGHPIPEHVRYIGTAQQGPYVWHAFWS